MTTTKLIFCLLLQLLSTQINCLDSDEVLSLIPDESSPCLRKCSPDSPPMDCHFKFIVENYQTLSRACYDCPKNSTDCLRPHCTPAEGRKRTITTVNRSIPGPAIEAVLIMGYSGACTRDELINLLTDDIEYKPNSIFVTISKSKMARPRLFTITNEVWINLIKRYADMRPPSVTHKRVCEGDRIKVSVENHMATEDTSIHWHGILQRNTPYMDGVPLLTQCPITGGSSFLYDFPADQVGTHMWHSHIGNQRGDGVFGALVIRQPKQVDPHSDLYDYDLSEHVMTIADWTDAPVQNMYVAMYNNGDEVFLSSILVNGFGYFYNTTYKSGIPAPRFHVEKGYRYRFRLINAGYLMCPIEISVDNHTMTVINTDGYDLKPITVSSFVSYAGERFDFIINTDQEIDHYWIRFHGLMVCQKTKIHQVAVLSYKGAEKDGLPPVEPIYGYRRKDGLTMNSVNEEMLKNNSVSIADLRAIQRDDESLKEIPDKKFYIYTDFWNISNSNYYDPDYYKFNQSHPRFNTKTFQINHISHVFQSFPLLSQRDQIKPGMFCNDSTVKNCTTEYCECTHVLQVALNEVVEIILVDVGIMANANHPYHLHGSPFRVIGMERIGTSVDIDTIKKMDEQGLLKRNLHNAPWKDAVTVPDGGYTIIRFQATNPGYWLFHCHVDFHATMGMALVFKVGEHEEMLPVPEDFPKCGTWNYTPQHL